MQHHIGFEGTGGVIAARARAQSLLTLPDPQLATALGMSQNATAQFRASTKPTRFQPVQDDGACMRACNITQ